MKNPPLNMLITGMITTMNNMMMVSDDIDGMAMMTTMMKTLMITVMIAFSFPQTFFRPPPPPQQTCPNLRNHRPHQPARLLS